VFKPDEVVVPAFLADLPQVRLEISEYYSSVRRCDDTVGALMAALDETGLAQNTIVMFLSDHGMPLPFAKTNVYYHSTRTPWIVRWPGKTQPGSVDDEHFISGIDLAPTLLDMVGIKAPDEADGFSFKTLLTGGRQDGREMVFTQFHQTAGRNRYPMRAVEDKRFRYIYNPWSDGKRVFRNESQSGRTMRAMLAAGKETPDIAARCKLFLLRVPEELYDLKSDPDALNNLVDDPEYRADLSRLRSALGDWMQRTEDPARTAFQNRDNEQARRQFMAEQDAQTGRKKQKRSPPEGGTTSGRVRAGRRRG
jgi:N-sulfoglucosamine sulfohydrolase